MAREFDASNLFRKREIPDDAISTAVNSAKESHLIKPAETSLPIYVEGQVYDVPLNEIHSNPYGPRANYPASAIDDMVNTLRSDKQLDPANAFISREGKVTLIDGETRLRATRVMSLPTLKVLFVQAPESPKELFRIARVHNKERRLGTALDDALVWKRLLDENIYKNQSELAAHLVEKEDHVSRVLSIAKLPQKVIHLAYENESLNNVRMLCALREYYDAAGEEKTVALAFEAVSNQFGYREVLKRREGLNKEPSKRPRAIMSKVMFDGVPGELKVNEDKGTLKLELANVDPIKLKDLESKIKTLLANSQ